MTSNKGQYFDYEAVVAAVDTWIFLLMLSMMKMMTTKNLLISIDSDQFDSLFDQAQ